MLIESYSSRSDAIELQQTDNFKTLTNDVQSLVAQITQGHTKLEGLVRAEHDMTREVVAQETVKTQKAINTHVTTEVQALGTNALTEAQRNSFLQSLKFPEMNQRYNDLMNSREASFKRVFASYEEMTSPGNGSQVTQDTNRTYLSSCQRFNDLMNSRKASFKLVFAPYEEMTGPGNGSQITQDADRTYLSGYQLERNEINQTWAEFIEWLQSSDNLFCIRGKPGSGKSTLVKFIIDNKNTTQLLLRWSQTATIISHFFWKIGSSPQNSVKGLLCSLVYRTLHGNQDMIDHAIHHFHHLSSNTSYHDWSMEDLETVLFFILEKDTRHLCIFVDGLDEICNKDGLFKLTQSIEKILKFSNVKICVSSRPETLVMNWLEKKNVRGVLLENLTRPEMVTFVHKELEPFISNKTISSETYEMLTHGLVWKAQGVFLWLHLATRSLATGIQNEDSEEMLRARVGELPTELTQLYVNMWQRLNENNSIYRNTAARLFRYALQDQHGIWVRPGSNSDSNSVDFQQPTLFQIACAESIETQDVLLAGTSCIDFTEGQRLCEKTKIDIQNRCAGLLRIESPRMQGELMKLVGKADGLDLPEGTEDVNDALFSRLIFIHRTAHDFLMDTEAGQDILKCGMLSESEVESRLLKGLFCLLRFVRSKYGIVCHPRDIVRLVIRLSETPANEGLEEAIELLQIVQNFYNNVVIRDRRPSWQPRAPFFSLLTDHAQFDDFIISSLAQRDSSVLATEVLREAWDPDFSLSDRNSKGPSGRLVEALISMGADPHAYAVNRHQFIDAMAPFARQGTAFTNLLSCGILSVDGNGSYECLRRDCAREMLKAMVSMATICPDLSATTLALGYIDESGKMSLANLWWLNKLQTSYTGIHLLLLYEVDMKFLLLRLLSMLAVKIDEDNVDRSQVNELLPRLENPSAKLSFIIDRNGVSKTPACHRVSAELSTPKITEHLFPPATDLRKKSHQVRAPEKIGSAYEDVMRLTRDPSVETVDLESAVVSLADKRLGFCTLLEAGMIPTLQYLKFWEKRQVHSSTIAQLKAAASSVLPA